MTSSALILSFTLIWVLLQPVSAAAPTPTLTIENRAKQLRLVTTVVQKVSCSPDHLALIMKFTFTNLGNEPVLIDKRSFVYRTLVSRNLEAAGSRKYEQEIRADFGGASFPFDSPDIANFVVLLPGKSYDLHNDQTRVSLVINDGTPTFKDGLRAGNYYLQVKVNTWSYVWDAQKFRRAWRERGVLWLEGATSVPMQITVDANRPMTKCS